MPKVPALDQNRYHLSIANLAQFRAKFGTGKFFLFVFGRNQKSVEELLYGPVSPRTTIVVLFKYHVPAGSTSSSTANDLQQL